MNSQKSEAKKAESLARSKTEEERFKTMIADKRGNNISFSDKVIFRHLDSQHYLYGSFDCAASGIGAFKIELRKELSEKIVFKLIAYRTYEKEGDEISVLAPFKIYHCETQCYLSYCMERLILDSNDGPIPYDPNISSEQQLVKPPFIKQAVYVEEGSTECQSERLPSSARFLLIN